MGNKEQKFLILIHDSDDEDERKKNVEDTVRMLKKKEDNKKQDDDKKKKDESKHNFLRKLTKMKQDGTVDLDYAKYMEMIMSEEPPATSNAENNKEKNKMIVQGIF